MTRRNALVLWFGVAGTLLLGPPVRGAFVITTVGTPGYQVTDLHLFAAPTGSPPDYPEAGTSFAALFPLHFPRVPHQPPYSQEFASGLASTGFPQGDVFSVSQFIPPSGIHLGFVLVPGPGAPIGSSPDFTSGPIIPLSVQPITAGGDVFLNGALFERNAFGFVGLISTPGIEGGSHFLVDLFENSATGLGPSLTNLAGAYEYRVTVRDVNGNGYDILAQFQAVPEPASLILSAISTACLAVCAWRHRRRVAS